SVWTGDESRTEEEVAAAFEDAFTAVWSGEAESDRLNSLVLTAGLSWRDVVILRTLSRYVRQIGTFSLDYIEEALVANPGIARALVDRFTTRFDPDLDLDDEARESRGEEQRAEILAALDQVASLDQDRILRTLVAVVDASLRTNFFRRTPEGGAKSHVSVKLAPRELPMLPEPRPAFEIWVY